MNSNIELSETNREDIKSTKARLKNTLMEKTGKRNHAWQKVKVKY
jgi:hypothetical protein